jgi:organic radical activating enzyme
MANEFCRKLSNSFRFLEKDDNIVYQPCCWIPPSDIPIEHTIQLSLVRRQFTRDVLANTEKNCHECISREKNNYAVSHRQFANSYIPEDATDGDMYHISVQLDSTCNAACVMCGPHFSSLWRIQNDPTIKLKDYSLQYQKLISFTNFDKLTRLDFLGGEPLLSEHNVDFLKRVTNPSNVEVFYNTNGSIFPNSELIELWSTFKNVDLCFSIDGMHEQFDYIRWPLSWKKVENNMIHYDSILKDKLGLYINFTANPMNIFYFKELEEWYSKRYWPNRNEELKGLQVSPCFGIWGIDATPLKLRKHIEDKFGTNHIITRLLKSHDEVPGKFEKLIENMEMLDDKRNTSYKDTFSEVLKIIG